MKIPFYKPPGSSPLRTWIVVTAALAVGLVFVAVAFHDYWLAAIGAVLVAVRLSFEVRAWLRTRNRRA